jgi:hypothetical protein
MPFLTFDLLEAGVPFEPVELEIGADLLARYSIVLGSRIEGPPGMVAPGFAPILARRSYLSQYTMPPGGVLIGQSVAWFAPVRMGRLEVRARVASTAAGRRPIATIETTIHQGQAGPAARIETTVSWP